MWDSNAPLQLLKTMPGKLGKEHLEKLQYIIDADKYKNSLISGFDLCGLYAPFCRGCKKTSIYPCAVAYLNMLKAEGTEIEIDAKPVTAQEEFAPSAYVSDTFLSERKITENAVGETAVSAYTPEETAVKNDFAVKNNVADNKADIPAEKSAEIPSNKINDVTDAAESERIVNAGLSSSNEQTIVSANRKIRIAVARKKI